jgi:hypothetical protein
MLIVPPSQIFCLNLGHSTLASPLDATTYYFSYFLAAAPGTTSTNFLATIDKACTIIAANFDSTTGTAGSNESWSVSIRVNNTTDTLIATVSSTSANRRWNNQALNIVLVAGDTINIKNVCPTWGTNPTNLTMTGYLTFRLN